MGQGSRLSRYKIDPRFGLPILDPTASISSPYGCRAGTRVDARCPEGFRMHNGVDIIADDRTAVLHSIYGGVVEECSLPGQNYTPGFGGYGTVVVVKLDCGLWTLHAHCSETLVRTGDRVEKGTPVARMGRTRGERTKPNQLFYTSGAHLHFEISVKPYPMSPLVDRPSPMDVLKAGPDFLVKSRRASDGK